ncbi:hypothetical protein [Bradyrhizobium erythrophlei]|uniref:Uncharacterized protein n=1 Tax=Bradyrhizobium erythrophlei TaxID=1437360 RepID=A0A1M5V6A5_9BRAD|nr:hypothetical protein [Bradyrhizobium erythrophlei]SHH70802.1 hypothetical protein SAMN05443248_5793 [Bradyrhizobium erythrophlei]
MTISTRHLVIATAFAVLACGLGGCGTINEKLADGLADYVPLWAGGLPADAPPRPGTAKYDEFMREREKKRLEPAAAKDEAARSDSSSLEPVH